MYNFPPPYSNFYKANKKPHPIKQQGPPNRHDETKHEEQNTNYINIFGIKLYSDDLIILFVIFILYNEKIKDSGLMICLLLLLLN